MANGEHMQAPLGETIAEAHEAILVSQSDLIDIHHVNYWEEDPVRVRVHEKHDRKTRKAAAEAYADLVLSSRPEHRRRASGGRGKLVRQAVRAQKGDEFVVELTGIDIGGSEEVASQNIANFWAAVNRYKFAGEVRTVEPPRLLK